MLNTVGFFQCFVLCILLHILLPQHRYIKKNPGPQSCQRQNLLCCHWNINSLVAQNLSKTSQLEAYNSFYNQEGTCMSETYETYFNLSFVEEGSSFPLDRYEIIAADHASNTKIGGVCICFKEYLDFWTLNFKSLSHYF